MHPAPGIVLNTVFHCCSPHHAKQRQHTIGPDRCIAMQKAIAVCGDVHIALLHQKFTAPGKEEFSETLRKFLKDKCPNTVVVGWGSARSGGKQGEHYHTFIVSALAWA